MLIACKKPLFSTPDVFEIYSNFQTYPDSVTEAPTEIPTTESATTDFPTPTITTIDSYTDETTDSQTLDCQFHENDHGAIFDTGSPYSNHLRQGSLTS